MTTPHGMGSMNGIMVYSVIPLFASRHELRTSILVTPILGLQPGPLGIKYLHARRQQALFPEQTNTIPDHFPKNWPPTGDI